MAEAPVLCFDGDAAGRRAAFKALETALPLIAPERSFRFAFLPEGQDPDDLARSGGASAIAEVLEKAKPLVDVLWQRESEGHPLDTPEQRAGLERRLGEAVRAIGDEALRRHYAAAMKERVAALFGPARAASPPRSRDPRRFPGAGGRFGRNDPLRGYLNAPLPTPSRSFTRSTAGSNAVIPPREALILASLLSHPALMERHFEELSALEFTNSQAGRLCDAIIHLSGDDLHDAGTLQHALDAHGLSDVRQRFEAEAGKLPHWHLRQDAAEVDADHVLRQALALHRRTRALSKALRVAEHALADETSERNLATLRDVQERLAALNGMEATVDGFGISSGRIEPEI